MHCSNNPRLFDHLVGAAKQRNRNGDAERLGLIFAILSIMIDAPLPGVSLSVP
jgi:hypothetical protein